MPHAFAPVVGVVVGVVVVVVVVDDGGVNPGLEVASADVVDVGVVDVGVVDVDVEEEAMQVFSACVRSAASCCCPAEALA